MSAITDRLAAALAGRYRIERELGAGGMATVYLCEDLKHDRKVAIKVLKPELAAVLGAERFVVEIKTTAAMSHPHILPLFDSGTADGFLFYVMPYIEGETIREKLNRETQFGVDEAVRIAREVADALDYAHRHGIIHRDIKPENILLHDGRAMVMDFGIALAVSAAAGGRMTETGLSLGTPHYMSPEQATAEKEITPRSDVYSLASVLYEMLAGEPPHSGGSAQAIIMKIIAEPAQVVTQLRKSVPANVAAALDKALQKVPADRFESAAKFAEALVDPAFATRCTGFGGAGAGAGSGVSRRIFAATAAVAVIATAVAAWAWLSTEGTGAAAQSVQFSIDLPDSLMVDNVIVAPDGSSIVIGARVNGVRRLYRRSVDDIEVREIDGAEGGAQPFFSPDGASIAFFAQGELRKLPLAGGMARTLATYDGGRQGASGTWGADGTIVVAVGQSGLWRTDADGGALRPFTTLDSAAGDFSHGRPDFLPDGRTVAFGISGAQRGAPIRLAFAALDGTVTRTELRASTVAALGGDSLVITGGEGSLSLVPFDRRKRTIGVAGPAVVTEVLPSQSGRPIWDVSANGTMAYLRGRRGRWLVTVSRAGATQQLLPDPRDFRRPKPSPDGERVVIEVMGARATDTELWIFDRRAGTLQRLTFGGGVDPVWTSDGKRVVFARRDSLGSTELHWQFADGSAPAERLLERDGAQFALAVTPDGKGVVFDDLPAGAGADIWLLPLEGDRTPRPILATEFSERLPSISPDGKWMAYTSDESGRVEVYVRPFPGPGAKVQVSVVGGDQPTWSGNGREIFYREASRMVAAAVQTSPTFGVTSRTPLFDDPFVRTGTLDYDVLPGGGFVMLRSSAARQLMVVTNWPPAP